MLKRIAGLVVLLWPLGCAGAIEDEGGSVSAPGGLGGLRVENVRVQLVPGGQHGAVYLDVINGSEVPDRLRLVESPAVQDIQTHESLAEDGVVRMLARPDGFEIPAGAKLELKEGGKHIMLLGIADLPAAGGKLLLRLHFDRAGILEVEAPVQTFGE
ncbi:MAG: copper chaperone PCu(A)C [Acidobacteriota bacterium]